MTTEDALRELKRQGLIENTQSNIPDSKALEAFSLVKALKAEFPLVTITEVMLDKDSKNLSVGFKCPEAVADIVREKISKLRNG